MALSFSPSPSCKCLFPLLGTRLPLEITWVSRSSSLRLRRGWTRSRVNFSECRPQDDTRELPKTWLDHSYFQKEHVLLFVVSPPPPPPVLLPPLFLPVFLLLPWACGKHSRLLLLWTLLSVFLFSSHSHTGPNYFPGPRTTPGNHRESCSLLWKPWSRNINAWV